MSARSDTWIWPSVVCCCSCCRSIVYAAAARVVVALRLLAYDPPDADVMVVFVFSDVPLPTPRAAAIEAVMAALASSEVPCLPSPCVALAGAADAPAVDYVAVQRAYYPCK